MKYISYLGGKIHETGPQIPLLYADCLHGRLCVVDVFPDIGAGGNGLGRIGMATGNRAVECRADGGDSLCAVKKGQKDDAGTGAAVDGTVLAIGDQSPGGYGVECFLLADSSSGRCGGLGGRRRLGSGAASEKAKRKTALMKSHKRGCMLRES